MATYENVLTYHDQIKLQQLKFFQFLLNTMYTDCYYEKRFKKKQRKKNYHTENSIICSSTVMFYGM